MQLGLDKLYDAVPIASVNSGHDAVEHAVQAEFEALVPGPRAVWVDARFHQADDPQVVAGGLEPPPVALAVRDRASGATGRLPVVKRPVMHDRHDTSMSVTSLTGCPVTEATTS